MHPHMHAVRIERERFGTLEGKDVWIFTLSSGGVLLRVSNYGASVLELHVPDRHGTLADVVLGLPGIDRYFGEHPFVGCVVGRVANRIADGAFTLEGTPYRLARNDGSHHLHGGRRGFDKVVWAAEPIDAPEGPAVRFRYASPDGDEGYPGNLEALVTYRLTRSGELQVDMEATTDRTTLVNLAQHNYWNLAGPDASDIRDHELTLFASHYTPGAPVVPTGRIEAVAETPFDFTWGKRLGDDLLSVGGQPPGFDHNFVVDGRSCEPRSQGEPGTLRPVARLVHPSSGRVLWLESDQPGVQLYTGNFLYGLPGKGQRYGRYAGVCLETQAFPNAINVPDWREQVILRPGQRYRHRMVCRFSTLAAPRAR